MQRGRQGGAQPLHTRISHTSSPHPRTHPPSRALRQDLTAYTGPSPPSTPHRPPPTPAPQTFLTAYFWLLTSLAAGGAAVPLLARAGDALGQPTWRVDVPEGLLLDEDGGSVTSAALQPSGFLGVGLAVALATYQATHLGGSFTLNNLVRRAARAGRWRRSQAWARPHARPGRRAARYCCGCACHIAAPCPARPGRVPRCDRAAAAAGRALLSRGGVAYDRPPGIRCLLGVWCAALGAGGKGAHNTLRQERTQRGACLGSPPPPLVLLQPRRRSSART